MVYATVTLWGNFKDMLKDLNPLDVEAEPDNYFQVLKGHLRPSMCWEAEIQAKAFDLKRGVVMEANNNGNIIMGTCWKALSRGCLPPQVQLPHGTMTTRLLGAHCALQATILLSESRNAMHLPEVLALIDSLSFMTVSFRAIG